MQDMSCSANAMFVEYKLDQHPHRHGVREGCKHTEHISTRQAYKATPKRP